MSRVEKFAEFLDLKKISSKTKRKKQKIKEIENLTHVGKFSFDVGHMFTVCDTEVGIRKRALLDAVWRHGGADGQHGGRTLGPLNTADLLHCRHFNRRKSVVCGGDI